MADNQKAERNEAFRQRTRAAAVRVMALFRQLPAAPEASMVGRQLLRCTSSVCINYRAMCRARSAAEFVAKLSICVEEGDEAIGWLELLGDYEIVSPERLKPLMREYDEIVAQLATARRTAIENQRKQKK